jgi:nicotinamide mononucleotide transporter
VSALDPAEAAGAAFGVAYVVLAIRENAWCWPVGIANAALFLVVCVHARLYGGAGLQAVYLLVSCYGWYEWLHGGEHHGRLPVSRTPARWAAGLAAGALVATLGLGLLLKQRTDAALPFPDAAATAFSLAAQWMATRKWLENWLVWIVVDVAYVAICLSQRLYAMAALYAVFLVLAVLGYKEWRASVAQREAPVGLQRGTA